MTFDNWLEAQGIASVSPEAYYAETAWNAAIEASQEIMQDTSSSVEYRVAKVRRLNTGLGKGKAVAFASNKV